MYKIYTCIFNLKKLFKSNYVSASVDIPVVNTQCKRSSQHIDMLHPYQWFISPLDHLHQW